MAWEVPLGTTSVTDLVTTAKLAAREALPTDDDGDLTLERGLPPYAKFIDTYHDRMFFAGDPKYPNRVFYSKLFEPEAVGASSFITTKDGEAITGIKRVGDQLLIFCLRATYELQGYSGDDFKLTKLTPSIGCISHHSIVNINERLWFASEKGVYVYDGGFRYVMDYIRSDWRTRYVADPTTFADCSAMDDQEYHMYKLLIPYSSAAFYYKLSAGSCFT